MAIDALVFIHSPAQWAVLGVVLVMIFAPRFLPPLARFFGYLVGREMFRRIGLPIPVLRRARRAVRVEPDVEILPPDAPAPTLRASQAESLARPPAAKRPVSVWLVTAVVGGAVAVLSWYLLRSR